MKLKDPYTTWEYPRVYLVWITRKNNFGADVLPCSRGGEKLLLVVVGRCTNPSVSWFPMICFYLEKGTILREVKRLFHPILLAWGISLLSRSWQPKDLIIINNVAIHRETFFIRFIYAGDVFKNFLGVKNHRQTPRIYLQVFFTRFACRL